jgi:Ran GTPase-activating protein (RanGAP) involved in mRNA processing and transport
LGTTAGIHLARMLTTNKTLTQLLLKNNQLKDRGMNAIAFALQNNISLTKLDVNNNHLTDRCFEAIMQLLSINRGLTELWLSDNEFSNETKEQFKNIEEKYGINLL